MPAKKPAPKAAKQSSSPGFPYGKPTARSARELLDQQPAELRSLLHQASRTARLEPAVLKALPADLASQTRCAGMADGTLTLVAANPAWAARLRFQGRALLRTLATQQAFQGLRSIKVTVAKRGAPEALAPKPTLPSAETNRHLAEFAEQMPASPLRDALAALARHTR